jgi:eukaryotic-like serine/threonine-protein kinase
MSQPGNNRASMIGLDPGNGEDSRSSHPPDADEQPDEFDSVLMGHRETSREELVERICVDQVRRWRAGQLVPAESYLARYPGLRDDNKAVFELIYGEYLLREERGERPSAAELRWRFPDFVDQLRHQVDFHDVLNSADFKEAPQSREPGSTADGDAEPDIEGPFVAPGFRILGELGRGGMGTVYKAWQVKLKRIVALKVLRADAYAETNAAARFQAEAEAAARFQHPNIVQVFEVGEHDGTGYLVLEYAAGGGLDRRLSENLQDPRENARLIEILARAIHFAHERGIVHRDLKPANVLLTDDGVPKITDFGLAKLLEREDALTRQGEIAGTPSYMAPEQVRGQISEIAPTTDVYSLGAILYETLTGRPPFKGTTPLSTLEQVATQEPLSPSKMQRHLPRDLVTICLKCLAKEPGRRYPTALALAEDLERFLHGRPILARPIPLWHRLAKWARRRPGSAVAIAGLLTLSTLLLGEGLYYNHRLRHEMLASRRSARAATEQRNLALTALNRLIYDVQEGLAQTPATRSLRRSLLDTAIRGLEELERSTAGASPDLSQAVAYQKLGEIFRVIGQSSVARGHYERSLKIAEMLHAAAPDDLAIKDVLFQDQMGLGHVDMNGERFHAATPVFRRAVSIAESIFAAKPGETAARRDLIEAYLQLGRSHSFAHEYADAEIWFQKMHDLAKDWVSEAPGQSQARDFLASALRKLADLRKFAKEYEEARRAYSQAIEIGREIVTSEPNNDPFRIHLALALDDLAGVEKQVGQLGEARRLYTEAHQHLAQSVASDPENLEPRLILLNSRHNLAMLDRQESRYQEAWTALVGIRDEVRRLARDGWLESEHAMFLDDLSLQKQIDSCAAAIKKSE